MVRGRRSPGRAGQPPTPRRTAPVAARSLGGTTSPIAASAPTISPPPPSPCMARTRSARSCPAPARTARSRQEDHERGLEDACGREIPSLPYSGVTAVTRAGTPSPPRGCSRPPRSPTIVGSAVETIVCPAPPAAHQHQAGEHDPGCGGGPVSAPSTEWFTRTAQSLSTRMPAARASSGASPASWTDVDRRAAQPVDVAHRLKLGAAEVHPRQHRLTEIGAPGLTSPRSARRATWRR